MKSRFPPRLTGDIDLRRDTEREREYHGVKPTILIAGYFGYGNIGDEAILGGILDDLDASLPQAEYIVVSGDPAQTTDFFGREAVGWNDLTSIIEAIRKSDLVIVGGGGLFHDYWPIDSHDLLSESNNKLVSYLSIPLLSTMLRKPSMAYSVGVGPLRSTSARDYVRFAFESFDAISVRDKESAALLKSIGVDFGGSAKLVVTADPTFRLLAAPIEDARAALTMAGVELERPVCGVNLRYWDFGVDPARLEGEVAQALDQWVERADGQVVFIPMQRGGRTPYEDDLQVCKRVQAALRSQSQSRILRWHKEPRQAAAVFAACTVNLSMRMHAALFSLVSGVPTVGLSYDEKVTRLFGRANLLDLVLPIENLHAGEIAGRLDLAMALNDPQAAFVFKEEMKERAGESIRMAVELLESGKALDVESTYDFADLAFEKSLRTIELERQLNELEFRMKSILTRQSELERALAAAELRKRQDSAETGELKSQLAQEMDRVGQLQAEHRNKRAAMQTRIVNLSAEHESINQERDSVNRVLSDLRNTAGMKILANYWLLMSRIIPPGSRRKLLYRRLRAALGKTLQRVTGRDGGIRAEWGGSTLSNLDKGGSARLEIHDRLAEYAASVADRNVGKAVLIMSPTPLSASEGQRATHLAVELANRGDAVVFGYWRWDQHDWSGQEYRDKRIVQLPMDLFLDDPAELLRPFAAVPEKTILIEFPYPGFFRLLASANAEGWVTIYDVVDNWEAFHQGGQAPWYDKDFEAHLASTADLVCAVSPSLQARLEKHGRAGAPLIPNGWPDGIEIKRRELLLERGEVTLGYFGYLSEAWFDWQLVREVAVRKPSWRLHLIGYGGEWPLGNSKPENVLLLGRRPQNELAALAANWDVGIVPFKEGSVAADADPIKIYEYLAMGLPVVASGVSPPLDGQAFVKVARGAEGFIEHVLLAMRESAEVKAERQAFAARSSWSVRVDSLLASIREQPAIEQKRALFAEVT
jgi:polysaccharide pyruvyl transferase CsaB